MFEKNHFYPGYVRDLVSELESAEFADTVLIKYHSKTISDPVLYRVYSLFNYPNSQEVPAKLVVEALMHEYMVDFPPIDSDSDGLKVSYTHTYYDNQINFLSDPTELGLDYHKQELLEAMSLNSLWSEDTNTSPIKRTFGAPKTTLRSKNGLKILSWKVKDIVEKLGNSTYQEVADYLVKETENNYGDTKHEKNIRRRVYDALNVLIAVGILDKTDKKVHPVIKKKNPIIDKIKKLKEISEKYLILKGIIERNRYSKQKSECIYFPFSLITVNRKAEKTVRVLANFQRTNVSIRVDQEFFIQTSDDLIKKLTLDLNYAWLPVELNSLLCIQTYPLI
jgi:E2F/DP family winged-helix DNA-binding domain